MIDVQADVVLAIGTRLGPFGALPQYGFDYWPKDAKIIQVYKIGMETYKSIYSSMIDNEMSKYLIIFAR